MEDDGSRYTVVDDTNATYPVGLDAANVLTEHPPYLINGCPLYRL